MRVSRRRPVFSPPSPLAAAFLAAALFGGTLGCSVAPGDPPAPGATGTSSLYVIPTQLADLAEAHFYDHPWPSDLRLENGSPRLLGFPNPRNVPILAEYLTMATGILDGFSPVGAGFLRFDGPIDPASLPATPLAALEAGASVQLLDIDPASPEHGERKRVSLRYQEAATVYYQADTLAFMPTIGFPLRTHTRYALVVTRGLRASDGAPIGPSADLQSALGLAPADARTGPAAKALAAPVAELAKAGIDASQVAHLAVFTTSDPTAELFLVADDVAKSVPAPVMDPGKWSLAPPAADFDEYLGVYGPSPNYQAGKLPFSNAGDGGQFNVVNGHPRVVNLFTLRFSLMVPKAAACPMPAAGYPIVLYSHGTGGDYRSYVGDGTGDALATRCVATMGIDQIFQGARPGAPPCVPGSSSCNGGSPDDDEEIENITFFNFQNPTAARTNGRQGAIDEVQRSRLFTETHATVPESISRTKAPIRFDGTKLMFFGHSQGGLNGPLYLAASGAARGGVLSGSGALMSITLLEKTQPAPSVAGLVATFFLDLFPEEVSEVSYFHPAISLAQNIIDVLDPIHYARHTITEPRPGLWPKSVYVTEGINPDGTGDSYAPPHGIEAHALALGLPVQLPEQHAILESKWGGPRPVTVPAGGLAGNLGKGAASGVLGQWPVPPGDDGHFVVFDVARARAQAATFLANLAKEPHGRVPPP